MAKVMAFRCLCTDIDQSAKIPASRHMHLLSDLEWSVCSPSPRRSEAFASATDIPRLDAMQTQSFDQKFENMNKALQISCQKGLPVRVVRSHKVRQPQPSQGHTCAF